VQNNTFDAVLAKLEYYSFDVIDRSKLELNSSGTDFTPASLSSYKSIDMPSRIVNIPCMYFQRNPTYLFFVL
jgi:DNA repair protein RadD